MKTQEFFGFVCPKCQAELNAAEVVVVLPDEVLRTEIARRNGRRQTPHAGHGRPTETQCPGCDQTMTTAELRNHRRACVRGRLERLRKENLRIRLYPKDPDPYPDFRILRLTEAEVTFRKRSSDQDLTVALQKIANITPQSGPRIADIELRGRVVWDGNQERWVFMSKAEARLPYHLSARTA